MNANRNFVNSYIAVTFEIVDGYKSVIEVLAANSLQAVSELVRSGPAYHSVKYSRDMPHYYGVAHLRLAGLL
jgi:hypothetical protein